MTSSINSLTPLYGLILSGGKSTRMGKDKGLLTYHNSPQIDHLTDLLTPFCNQVFVSAKHMSDYLGYPVIEDQYSFESPLNGILSALTRYPKSAWLVVACDMPFIDIESIEHLISHRASGKLVTCYTNQRSLIEPLFSIWESQAKDALKTFQENGDLSPMKFLEENKTTLVTPVDQRVLININTIEEFENLDLKNQ